MPSPIVSNTTANLNGKRLLKNEDLPIYRVEDYGAVGDGVTDDSIAIQNCINTAATAGGTVLFQPTTYAISQVINIAQGLNHRPIHLQGAGAWMKLQVTGIPGTEIKYTGGGIPKVFSGINLNGFTMRSLNINCGNANTGLYLESCTKCTIEQISVKGSKGYSYWFRGAAAGLYRCAFNNLSNEDDCISGMLLDSFDISVFGSDVAQCTFNRVDLYYNSGIGLDLTSADNCLFVGLTVICVNGAGAGEAIRMRDRTVSQFGCCFNTFIQVDGNTITGTVRGVLVDTTFPNLGYGFDFANGLIITVASLHPENFLIEDTTGFKQTNLAQWVSGKAFGGASVLQQMYYDTSSNKFRFQSHQAATRRGWIWSGNAAAGAEVVAFEVDPDGGLLQRARTDMILDWTPTVYAAGDYTASAGTMTTTAPNTKSKWTRGGQTGKFKFAITGIAVSNAGVVLRIQLPPKLVNKNDFNLYWNIRVIDNGGAPIIGQALLLAGASLLQLFTSIAGAGFAISAGTTEVYGQIEIETTVIN